MRIHGRILGEGNENYDTVLGIGAAWTGTTVLAPDEGKTNDFGRLRVYGNLEIASGTTIVKSKTAWLTRENTPLFICGNNSSYLDSRKLTLSGGLLTCNQGNRFIETSNYGQFIITGGFANFHNLEYLNGLQSPARTTISGTGVLECGILRASQSGAWPMETTAVNICTGGVVRLNQFWIDESGNYQCGVVNLNGGTIVPKVNTSAFFGSDFHLWKTNILFYVREGGAIVSNKYAISSKNTFHCGAERDGGLTLQGSGTLTLLATNTYNGATTVQGGTLQLAYPLNTLPPTNTLAVCAGAACSFTVSSGVLSTQTLARIEGAGNFNASAFLTVTDSIAPGDGTNGVGTLTLSTACKLGGTLEVDGDETSSDCLTVSSGVQDISKLSVNFNNLAKLNKKKVYTVFNAPSGFTGKFASTNLGKGASWVLRYGAADKKVFLVYNAGTVVMLM